MSPNMGARTYRPRQQVVARTKARKQRWTAFVLLGEHGKILAAMAAVAVVLGLALTQIFHGQAVDLQAKADQLRARNSAIANENVRLLAARAQVASKTQVAALAKTKLKLFEPDQGQVRRM